MRKFFIKLATTLMMSPLILTAGLAYADTGTITNTGPGSTNQVDNSQTCTSTTDNTNSVDVGNNTGQSSSTGGSTSTDNNKAGSATSGSSQNSSSSSTDATITNSSSNPCQTATSGGGKGGGQGGSGGGSTSSSQPAAGKGGGVAASSVAQPQVEAPKGGVGAGDGGAVRPYASLAVLVGSLLAGGVGFRLLRQVQEG